MLCDSEESCSLSPNPNPKPNPNPNPNPNPHPHPHPHPHPNPNPSPNPNQEGCSLESVSEAMSDPAAGEEGDFVKMADFLKVKG